MTLTLGQFYHLTVLYFIFALWQLLYLGLLSIYTLCIVSCLRMNTTGWKLKSRTDPILQWRKWSGFWNVVFFVQDNMLDKAQTHNNLKCNASYTNDRIPWEINSHSMEWTMQKRISSLMWMWKQNPVSQCIQLINSMEQNYYWISPSHSASHQILHLLWYPKVSTRGCTTKYPSSVLCTSSYT
jgi:hypothetical protein